MKKEINFETDFLKLIIFSSQIFINILTSHPLFIFHLLYVKLKTSVKRENILVVFDDNGDDKKHEKIQREQKGGSIF
jgi:hypothetical protein